MTTSVQTRRDEGPGSSQVHAAPTPSQESTGSTALTGHDYATQAEQLRPSADAPPPADTDAEAARISELLTTLAPRVTRVTDPVAFLNNASYNVAVTGGAALKSAAGFFGQADAEITALIAEIDAARTNLSPSADLELQRLRTVLSTWRAIYQRIANTGMSKEAALDMAVREKTGASVREALALAQEAIAALGRSRHVGRDVVESLIGSWSDLSIFVETWTASSGGAGPSPYMWGAFLMTVERYRQILNQYGALEERGGDATETGMLAVKDSDAKAGMVGDRARFEEVSAERGGTMVLALETYKYRAANIAACQVQVEAMLKRVEAGEFKTAEEAAAAFRSSVGAGLGSPEFNENVEQLARGAWETKHGDQLEKSGRQETDAAREADRKAQTAISASDHFLGRAKGSAKDNEHWADEGDKHRADAAWKSFETHREKATQLADRAMAEAAKGDLHRGKATEYYLEAEAALASARVALGGVDVVTFPHLAPGLQAVEARLGEVRSRVAEGKDELAALQKASDDVHARARQMRAEVEDFDPERAEVDAPHAGDGATLQYFRKFGFSVFIKPLSILKISVTTSGEHGYIQGGKKGVTSYNEEKESASIALDLYLFTLEFGVEGKSRYEVDAPDHLSEKTVNERGAAEKARWEAAKEIKESGAEDRLVGAFDGARMKLRQTFELLHKAAKTYRETGDRATFEKHVDMILVMGGLRDASADLRSAIVWRGGGPFIERLQQAKKLPDPKVIEGDVQALKNLSPDEIGAELSLQEKTNDQTLGATRDQTLARFREVSGFSNDPDVRFKNSGSVFVGVELDSGPISAAARYTRVTSVSDGDGKEFSFEEKVSDLVEVSVKIGDWTGTLSVESSKGNYDIGFELRGHLHLGGKKEQEELQKNLGAKWREAVKRARSLGTRDGIVSALKDAGKEIVKHYDKDPEIKSKLKADVIFGLDLKFGADGSVGGEFSIGTVASKSLKGDFGAFGGEAKFEAGMKAVTPLF